MYGREAKSESDDVSVDDGKTILSRRLAFLRGVCEQAQARADGEPSPLGIIDTAIAVEKITR